MPQPSGGHKNAGFLFRIFGFDLTGRTGVTLQGLHFKTAAMNLENAVNFTEIEMNLNIFR
jgi:hypothetical protein